MHISVQLFMEPYNEANADSQRRTGHYIIMLPRRKRGERIYISLSIYPLKLIRVKSDIPGSLLFFTQHPAVFTCFSS